MAWIAAALVTVALAGPASAPALITSPVTIAGPASDVIDLGGVAMAPDGTGGAVYTRLIDGVPHVFASRFDGSSWSAPLRVDGDLPYEASQPRIAAGRGGALLVVWVSQVATIKGKVRYGLFSAAIGRGASSFRPSLLVDPEVGEGSFAGVDPSVSGTATGQAIVAYRVVNYRYDNTKAVAIPQLRPGDVLSEVRVARLRDDRWARLGAVNVSQELSTRAPSATNAPQAGAGIDGGAVVAWQESDQGGVARIYLRRVFGNVLGQALQASPAAVAGDPVTADADAFSLAVTPLNQARVAIRIPANGGQGPTRLFLNTLPAGFEVPSNQLLGAEQVFSAGAEADLGLPGVAAYEKGGEQGMLKLAFVSGQRARQLGVSEDGALGSPALLPGPAALPGAEAGAAVDPEGGGMVAYPSYGIDGRPAVAVRQEFPTGAVQSGLLTGVQTGPVAGLRVDGSGRGDALVGFRQGEAGHYQIVVSRVTAPPAGFNVKAPKKWTKPRAVKLSWRRAESAVGGVRYSVVVGGRTAKRGLLRRQYRPPAGLLGNGVTSARVVATDAVGGQVLSRKLKLKVDGQPPLVRLRGPNAAGGVSVRLRDRQSGLKVKRISIRFGDGSAARRATRFRHAYERPGRYRIQVRASDQAGNRIVKSFRVRVR